MKRRNTHISNLHLDGCIHPSKCKLIGSLAGPIAFFLILIFFKPDDLSDEGIAILATTVWVAIWWVTEALPIEVTSLLPIVLFPLTNGLDLKSTTAAYGHKFIFLFIGGFILAIGIEKWNLHRRIALNIVKLVGTKLNSILLGFMLSTAFLSMWISNTATTVMMLPIAMAVIKALQLQSNTSSNQFGKALMLSIAYSASIGGMATLIGTPPNLIFAGVVEELYGFEISFLQWLKFALPISMILLAIVWFYLGHLAFQLKQLSYPGEKSVIQKELKALGKTSKEEFRILVVFIVTAMAWMSKSFLIAPIFPGIDDTIIAIIAAISLFIIPASQHGKALIEWADAVKLPWGILLLFGGGIALAIGFDQSGLAAWIGQQLSVIQGMSLILVILIVIATVNFLTEITSNIATTAILLPIFAALSVIIKVHPFLLLAAATIAASCAFMLPVATAPNALVFGSGQLQMKDMFRTGLWLNIISIIVLTFMVYFILPEIWDFQPLKVD